jgi:hypothetical protein
MSLASALVSFKCKQAPVKVRAAFINQSACEERDHPSAEMALSRSHSYNEILPVIIFI